MTYQKAVLAALLVLVGAASTAHAGCNMKRNGIEVNAGVTGDGEIEITSSRGGNIHRYRQDIIAADQIDFACNSDVIVGDNYAVVRSGRNRDRISFYGVYGNGRIAATGMHLDREYQGTANSVELESLPTSFIAKFDHNQKRSVRFCFHMKAWTGSDESGDRGTPGHCYIPIKIVGYSPQVQ